MAKETRAYYGALASVPSGPGSCLVPFPDAGFPLSGYPRPPIASSRKYSVPLRSQERGGTEVLSGDIHPTGFPCLNAAGFCSYPKRIVMETYRAKPRIRPSPAGHGILYSAGLRISELLELKPGDINESRNLIRVRQGKGRKDRYTLLSRPLMKKLAEYNRLYRPQSWLFERRPGEPFTESIVSKRLKAAAREAGITKRIYPHLLRHSFATHLLEQGTDIKIVKELMGHNNIKTTERYVHIADTYKSNIKSPLDDLLTEEDGD